MLPCPALTLLLWRFTTPPVVAPTLLSCRTMLGAAASRSGVAPGALALSLPL